MTRGICDNCNHPRWQHFNQNIEMGFQKVGKCSICPCSNYQKPKLEDKEI